MTMKEFDKDGNEIKVDEKTNKERKAAFDQICKKAILVNMTRKQLSNMPFDVQTSNDVAKKFGVQDASMIQVRKLLFNPEHLSKIRSLINDALLMVWNHTRPWDNIGYRLLPMEYHDDFNETFGKIKDEFEEAVKEFIDNYDDYVKESKKLLGKMFNKNDYPDKAQLTSYFNLEIETAVFPDIDDIRLNMSGPELVSMKKEIIEKYSETLNESINELLEMVEKDPKDPKTQRLYDVAVKLNINENPEIDMKLEEVKDKIGVTKSKSDKKNKKEESMMVMDDIDDIDEIMDDYL